MANVDFPTEFEQARDEFAARVQAMVDDLSTLVPAAEREEALLADLEEAQERVEFLEQLFAELRVRAVERRDWTMVSVIDAALRTE